MKRYGWHWVMVGAVGVAGCAKVGDGGGRDLGATTQVAASAEVGGPTTQTTGGLQPGERDLVATDGPAVKGPEVVVDEGEVNQPPLGETRRPGRPVVRTPVRELAAEAVMPVVASNAANSNLIGPPVPAVLVEQVAVQADAGGPIMVPDPLVTDITRRAAEGRGDVMAQLDYQLLQYLRGQTVPDVGQLSQLAEGERELVMAIGDALANLRALPADARLEARRAAVMEMTERLASAGGLAVSRVMLCSEVTGFGQYKAVDASSVPAGRETPVVAYVEVTNFRSKLLVSQEWETRLSMAMSLHAASGAVVWQDKPAAVVDICKNRRRDFFVPRLVRLPVLSRGDYVLRVTVTDANSGLVTEATLAVGVR